MLLILDSSARVSLRFTAKPRWLAFLTVARFRILLSIVSSLPSQYTCCCCRSAAARDDADGVEIQADAAADAAKIPRFARIALANMFPIFCY